MLNVVSGERYSITLDEIALYVQGHYGETPAPVDQDVKDRVLSTPRGKALLDWERPEDTIEDYRRRYGGPRLTDDELLCRHFAPMQDIEATRAAGPMKRGYDFATDLPELIEQALDSAKARRVRLRAGGIFLDLRRETVNGKAGP